MQQRASDKIFCSVNVFQKNGLNFQHLNMLYIDFSLQTVTEGMKFNLIKIYEKHSYIENYFILKKPLSFAS